MEIPQEKFIRYERRIWESFFPYFLTVFQVQIECYGIQISCLINVSLKINNRVSPNEMHKTFWVYWGYFPRMIWRRAALLRGLLRNLIEYLTVIGLCHFNIELWNCTSETITIQHFILRLNSVQLHQISPK